MLYCAVGHLQSVLGRVLELALLLVAFQLWASPALMSFIRLEGSDMLTQFSCGHGFKAAA